MQLLQWLGIPWNVRLVNWGLSSKRKKKIDAEYVHDGTSDHIYNKITIEKL